MVYLAYTIYTGLTREGPIDYHWVGNLTDSSATVKLVSAGFTAPIDITVNGEMHSVSYVNGTYTLDLAGLESDTVYSVSYLDRALSFKTPGQSFKFAAVSCAHTASESEVFASIASHKPEFIAHLGDLHYAGHWSLTSREFKYAVHEVMASRQGDLLQNTPLVYLLDDHDSGKNNANSRHPSVH